MNNKKKSYDFVTKFEIWPCLVLSYDDKALESNDGSVLVKCVGKKI